MTPLARILGWFVEPVEASPGVGTAAPARSSPAAAPAPVASTAAPAGAVVGTTARAVLPVAAAAAGELRVRAEAPAAVVALWHPVAAPHIAAGAATPAARRLAALLGTDVGVATARGRLAWLALPTDPEEAVVVAGRIGVAGRVPVVLAVCGPRPEGLEPLIARQDVAVAVLPADADPDLRALALATLPAGASAVHAPLPPGPPRWAALAGLARLRSLPAT